MDGLLSVIIPAYNEEQMIEKTAQTIDKILLDGDILDQFLMSQTEEIRQALMAAEA